MFKGLNKEVVYGLQMLGQEELRLESRLEKIHGYLEEDIAIEFKRNIGEISEEVDELKSDMKDLVIEISKGLDGMLEEDVELVVNVILKGRTVDSQHDVSGGESRDDFLGRLWRTLSDLGEEVQDKLEEFRVREEELARKIAHEDIKVNSEMMREELVEGEIEVEDSKEEVKMLKIDREDIQKEIEEGDVKGGEELVEKREVVSRRNTELVEDERVLEYTLYGKAIARGTSPLYVVEDYLYRIGEELEEQEWRDVVDFPMYEVSTLGLIRNKETGKYIVPMLKEKYVEGKKSPWRLRVKLRKEGESYTARIHRLVVEAFIGDIPEGKVVSHKNDIPLDNRLSNLEIVTRKRNERIFRILEEIDRGYIDRKTVDYIYEGVQEVVEDLIGNKDTYIELTDEDLEEVSFNIGFRPTIIREVYMYKKGFDSVFDDFIEVDGLMYDPEISKLIRSVKGGR